MAKYLEWWICNNTLNCNQPSQIFDKRKHVQWLVDSNDEIQSTVAVELENAKSFRPVYSAGYDYDAPKYGEVSEGSDREIFGTDSDNTE